MEEDIKILEKLIKEFDEFEKRQHINIYMLTKREKQAIEHLIERNKELEKHYQHEQEYINGEIFSAKQMHYIEDNYIDKAKVREKIEELKEDEEFYREHSRMYEFESKIKLLQELLEENSNHIPRID